MTFTLEQSDGQQLPKRQLRCDEEPLDDSTTPSHPLAAMECENSPANVPTASYRDMVMGHLDETLEEDLLPLEDDDIDLLDDDVEFGDSNGIPFINFSERVHNLALKSMGLTLIVKILGRCIGYTPIYNRILSLWQPVRLPGLPITWCKRSTIQAIGERIGSVLKIDYQTNKGRRGRFARMAIELNLTKPLVSKIEICGHLQLVEYESLRVLCFNCGIYGHTHTSDLFPRNEVDSPATNPQQGVNQKEATKSSPSSALNIGPFRFSPLVDATDSPQENDTAHVAEETIETALPKTSLLKSHKASSRSNKENIGHKNEQPKNKGKGPTPVRKPPVTTLGPKNMNIASNRTTPKHTNIASGSRTRAPKLNPVHHVTVTIEPDGTPHVLGAIQLPPLPSSSANEHDNRAMDIGFIQPTDPSDIPITLNSHTVHNVDLVTPQQNMAGSSPQFEGCGSRNFIRVMRQYLQDNKPDLCVFVETRIHSVNAENVISLIGFPNSFRVKAMGFYRGIWLCWYDSLRIDILFSHFQFVHCRITDQRQQTRSFLATFVYASPRASRRKISWNYLKSLATISNKPWIIMGDLTLPYFLKIVMDVPRPPLLTLLSVIWFMIAACRILVFMARNTLGSEEIVLSVLSAVLATRLGLSLIPCHLWSILFE
ncbi:hypothetical protein F3Y22_tig00112259pilonHSYRG00045 [Hibiscus syriacus]|uniref:Uncharacterized protein n=1 Tax=Hibiscus syriacus TaxID=106335 RepID=A0A6A2X332_HIBSY|nr:hypothetical protein F3Y22_tig00112259pilonHSYRG00045 [Hibiscus syriacus]